MKCLLWYMNRWNVAGRKYPVVKGIIKNEGENRQQKSPGKKTFFFGKSLF